MKKIIKKLKEKWEKISIETTQAIIIIIVLTALSFLLSKVKIDMRW